MNFTLALLGISIYLLFWEMLPHWGTWFNRALKRLPAALQSLYEQWHCAYCVGFWLALALHAITGQWTLPSLADMPDFWGSAGPVTGWFLDALATATLIYAGKYLIDAIKLPAMISFLKNDEYMKAREDKTRK